MLLGTGVVLLGAADGDKVRLVAGVTKDLAERISAVDLVNAAAGLVGGKGGGRPDLAQAGGADAARLETGGHLAGYIAYEAGLALEPKLAGLAEARSGAAGPLVWLGLFESAPKSIPAAEMKPWLAARGRSC